MRKSRDSLSPYITCRARSGVSTELNHSSAERLYPKRDKRHPVYKASLSLFPLGDVDHHPSYTPVRNLQRVGESRMLECLRRLKLGCRAISARMCQITLVGLAIWCAYKKRRNDDYLGLLPVKGLLKLIHMTLCKHLSKQTHFPKILKQLKIPFQSFSQGLAPLSSFAFNYIQNPAKFETRADSLFLIPSLR